ncbi:MAG: hypothetical protein REI94_16020 [Moraxellaceae bacterium]|nr:hypothetical protein [Moraxellaceae bacterium]
MLSRFCFLAVLLLLGARIDAHAAPTYSGTVIDPAGDAWAGGPPDIASVTVTANASQFTFTMYFHGAWDPAVTRSTFGLDTDQNVATGSLYLGWGFERIAHQGFLGNTGTAYLFAGSDLATPLATTAVSYFSDHLSYSFDAALFADEGLLDFLGQASRALSANSSTGAIDNAPGIQPRGPGGSTQLVPIPSTLSLLLPVLLLALWQRAALRRNPLQQQPARAGLTPSR